MATFKQRKLAAKISENPRKSVSSSMREVGYSDRSAEKPQQVTNSKGFKEIFREVFTPEYLRKHHEKLMNGKVFLNSPFYHKIKDKEIQDLLESQGYKFIGVKRFMTEARVYFIGPDLIAKDKALDKAYKLLGEYAAIKVQDEDPLAEMSDDELDEKIAERAEILDRYKKFKTTRKKKKKSH